MGFFNPVKLSTGATLQFLFFLCLKKKIKKYSNNLTSGHVLFSEQLSTVFHFCFFFSPFVLSFSLFLGTSHSWTGWHRSCSSSFHSFETCWLVTGPVYAPLLLNRGRLFQHFFLSLNLFFSLLFSLSSIYPGGSRLIQADDWQLEMETELLISEFLIGIRENIGSEVILLIKWDFFFSY